jgi:GNAT superfamily N-acetyltransferase
MIPVVGWTGLLHLALVMDKMERYHPKERHYYLQFIGVVPEHQGSGTGTDLMKPILDICDREKCVAYLKNSKEANLQKINDLHISR